MKKYLKGILVFSGIHLLITLASCSDDVECGRGNDKFGITGFSIIESRFEDENNLFNALPVNTNDTISYDSLYLNMNANIQTFSYQGKGSFIGSAYACSPIPPSPVDTVANIQVFSQEQTGVFTFTVLDNLTDHFDIISFTQTGGFNTRISLKEFNLNERLASSSYFLFPTQKPDSITNISYKVIVNFNDGDSFEASSRLVNLAP